MFGLFTRHPKVLAVGSLLIDTVAVREIKMRDGGIIIDDFAPGEITTSLGGCCYNIAINLGLLSVPGHVGLFTYLPTKTATTALALARMKRLGVSTSYVYQTDNLASPPINDLIVRTGGFVGARDPHNPELRIYAVQDLLGAKDFLALPDRRSELISAIDRCNAVVMECGLHIGTLQRIMTLCADAGIPIIVHIVSAIKARQYWDSISNFDASGARQKRVFCVSGKPKEIARLLEISGLQKDEVQQFTSNCVSLTKPLPRTPADLCTRLATHNILVTPERPNDGRVRWALLSNDLHFKDEFNVGMQPVQNYLGLSESTCAAFIHSSVKSGYLKRGQAKYTGEALRLSDSDAALYKQSVKDAARFALLSPGATPDSVITEKDAELEKLPLKVRLRAITERIETLFTWGNFIYTTLLALGLLNLKTIIQFIRWALGLQ
jgi:hypothetical protein